MTLFTRSLTATETNTGQRSKCIQSQEPRLRFWNQGREFSGSQMMVESHRRLALPTPFRSSLLAGPKPLPCDVFACLGKWCDNVRSLLRSAPKRSATPCFK